MTDVKCKVSSCHYWASGDICEADTILIDQDQMRSDTTRMEASSLDLRSDNRFYGPESSRSRSPRDRSRMEAGLVGGTASKSEHSARTSEATCCRTFRPKGSPKL
ncbi:MAG TPA: DUF1540 domain-containing protein [Firmicutes bacterium]|nr:DUF1540 domain-containing protein [Candidatus Fermentithermobacillaceae bacterium]